jgi:putative Mg2+ transporter-C (MgtC) family protein
LIGFGAALFMLVSKYGFTDVLGQNVVLDPSRVAAQIVSGIGFIGGGLIFVKRELVRGLTTAATVWLTTAVGMAAGAGLSVLALATTLGYFAVVFGLTPLSTHLGRTHLRPHCIEIIYQDGQGLLRQILSVCTARGMGDRALSTRRPKTSVGMGSAHLDGGSPRSGGPVLEVNAVPVVLTVHGVGGSDDLVATLSELDGVRAVSTTTPDVEPDPEVE